MQRLRAGSLFVAAWLVATTARAEAPLALEWTAPPGCPNAESVEASVRRLLSTPPRDPLHVRAVVRPDDAGWVVDLKLDGAARGTRTLHATSCASVARAAALIVALALDPQAATVASEEMAQAEAEPAPPFVAPAPAAPARAPSSSAPPPPRVPPPPPHREGIRGHGFALAAIERGYVPGVVPAALFGGGLGARFWRADVMLQVAPFASGSLAEAPQYGADFTVLSAEARGCGGPSWAWLALHGCAGLRGSRITGHGTGVNESYRAHAEILAATAGVVMRVPSGTRVAGEASLDAGLPLSRPDFVLLDQERERSIHRVQAVTIRAALGVSVRF